MKFQLRLLEVFVTVVEAKSLKLASKKINRTMSSISMALKQLELHLGQPLFNGDKKSHLTPLGEFVYHRAKRALQEREQTLEDIELYTNGKMGLVRIAAVPSMAQTLLADTIEQFIHEDIKVEMRDTNSTSVIAAVEQGDAEFGIASISHNNNHINSEFLFKERLKILCHKDHQFAKLNRAIEWSDIREENFLISDLCTKIASSEMQEISRKSKIYIYNMLSLFTFVEKKLGITFVPQTVLLRNNQCVMLDFNDETISRKIYLITRKDRYIAPLAQNMIKNIRMSISNL